VIVALGSDEYTIGLAFMMAATRFAGRNPEAPILRPDDPRNEGKSRKEDLDIPAARGWQTLLVTGLD
jgi:hypothetical protein